MSKLVMMIDTCDSNKLYELLDNSYNINDYELLEVMESDEPDESDEPKEKEYYNVTIHYEGTIYYGIHATSEEEAKEVAEDLFMNSDEPISADEWDICDIWKENKGE